MLISKSENSELSLLTDRVGKGWFFMLCHESELIGFGINCFDSSFLPDRTRAAHVAMQWQGCCGSHSAPPHNHSASGALINTPGTCKPVRNIRPTVTTYSWSCDRAK
jgi:hypothetical protein